MNLDSKIYQRYADAHAKRSPILKNCARAFYVGGLICALGQILIIIFRDLLGIESRDAGTLCSVTLIFIAVCLSGAGVFDKIAKLAGGGTLLPITGFANSVVSPAIDSKAEGMILGIGAKIFAVAGPVLLYGLLAGSIWGVIYYITTVI